MNRLKNYLYFQLSASFFQMFFVLFTITSIIFLVRIASLTSVIEMNFMELFTLYAYSLPNIIFYTLPIVYLVALVLTISRLSNEYEITIFTAFGLNPYKILKIFLPLTFLVTLTLLIISIGLIPYSKYLSKQFVENKKEQAKININASQNGQKFGNWLVYIQSEMDNVFYNVTMFKNDSDTKELISANKADTISTNNQALLNLYEGKAFIISQDFNQIDFEKLTLLNNVKYSEDLTDNYMFHRYWVDFIDDNKKTKDLSLSILVSIFPLISLFLVIYIGYFNPRYETNRSNMLISIAITIYIITLISLNKNFPIESLFLIPLIWIFGGFILMKKYILSRY